jgi:hypothetical protein
MSGWEPPRRRGGRTTEGERRGFLLNDPARSHSTPVVLAGQEVRWRGWISRPLSIQVNRA